VTGWLAAVFSAVTAEFAAVVAVLPAGFSADVVDENDGDTPGDPPVNKPEGPGWPGENDAVEYGADDPGCTADIEWCSPGCVPAPAVGESALSRG
jgi:hypothetical protein